MRITTETSQLPKFETFRIYLIHFRNYSKTRNYEKTSMMWPSQKFLLYNGTVIKIKVNEWINNLRKYDMSVPLPFGDTCNLYKL